MEKFTDNTEERGWSEPWDQHEDGEYIDVFGPEWRQCMTCGRSWDAKRFPGPSSYCIGSGGGPKWGGVPWECTLNEFCKDCGYPIGEWADKAVRCQCSTEE